MPISFIIPSLCNLSINIWSLNTYYVFYFRIIFPLICISNNTMPKSLVDKYNTNPLKAKVWNNLQINNSIKAIPYYFFTLLIWKISFPSKGYAII